MHDNKVALGVVPIENSIGGSIHRNYDLLVETDLAIVGEVQVPVVHNLLALPGVRLEDVRRVLSHPQALAQCAGFLRTLKDVEAIATYDTAGSAKMVRDEGRRDTAAIASERAGSLFGLEAIKSGVEDFKDNITRFLAVGRDRVPLGTPDKTSVVFTLKSEPGALFKALSVFALRGIDLTKLESRPVPGRPWEYRFYVDVAAAREDLRARARLCTWRNSRIPCGRWDRIRAGAIPSRWPRVHRDPRAGADTQRARPWLTRRSAS